MPRLLTLSLVLAIFPVVPSLADEPLVHSPVFTAGEGGYHTYRIPSLLVTAKGTLLAFCEGRKKGTSDAGDIDLVLRRSLDGGKSWQPMQVAWDDGPNTCGNPCPVVERESGVIWLLLTHNLGEDKEPAIIEGTSKGSRTAWVSKSTDDGVTWAKPVEITKTVKQPDWTWYASGPGVGIQTKSGRLVIPCDNKVLRTQARQSHVIYSDDMGYFLKKIVGKFAVLTQNTGILASFLVITGNIGILANSGQLAAINYILLHHTGFGINE